MGVGSTCISPDGDCLDTMVEDEDNEDWYDDEFAVVLNCQDVVEGVAVAVEFVEG